jgi:hypothetical protein
MFTGKNCTFSQPDLFVNIRRDFFGDKELVEHANHHSR